MSTHTVCLPITEDGQVDHSWGKARMVALATVADGVITAWEPVVVNWQDSHDQGSHGGHHARIARFIRDNGVTTVLADHMGPPMQNMLTKLGVDVRLGASGDARELVSSL